VSELESTLILVDSLKVSLRRARLFQADPEASKTSGSFVEYESKIKELKEERAELYKQQSQQATQMLHLNDQLRGRDSSIVTLTNQISSLKGVQEQQSEDNRRLEENIKEKDAAIQNISDELITLQLELLRLDQWQQQQQCINPDNNDKNTSSSSLNILARRMKIVKEKEIVAPHQYPLSCFASNAISHQLLTGSEDQKIILYDLTRISTKSVLKWSQMNGPIVALAIDESGSFVASCSAYDAEVTIWSLQSGKIQNTLQFSTEEDCPSKFIV
jgi:WD40 repeat protein